jgi:hypothetical protein
MKRYRSHKIVEAGQIVSFTVETSEAGRPTGAYVVKISADGVEEDVTVPPAVFMRGVPAPGDYLVKYEGGYISWSPKKAFEDGYTADPESEGA